MAQIAIPSVSAPARVKRHLWLRILGTGLLMYILFLMVMFGTGNAKLFPAVLWLGNFLVPVTYVAFFYERREHSSITLPALIQCFFWGATLGPLAAVLAEGALIRAAQVTIPLGLEVGAIEEWAKLLGVLVVAWRWRRGSVMDGIILGAAAGMGFAALESSGYAFEAFVSGRGALTADVIFAVGESLLRGLLAPLLHGTWTALLVGALFRERGAGLWGVWRVVAFYLFVILLHGLWDGTAGTAVQVAQGRPLVLLAVPVVMLGVGVVGVVALRHRWREARRLERAQGAAGNTQVAALPPPGVGV